MTSVHFYVEAELSVDEKYKKTLEEIEALKDHLGMTTYQTIYCCCFAYELPIMTYALEAVNLIGKQVQDMICLSVCVSIVSAFLC